MAVQNSLASRGSQKLSLSAYLSQDAVNKNIADVVGKDKARFTSSIISAVKTNPQLQECTNVSILNAALLGQSLNLTPSPQLGQYYMVPFNNRKQGTTEAQFQLGYKGYVQLALRSGQYKKLNVLEIKEGELIKFDPLNEEIEVNLIADVNQRDKAKTIGYYAMFEYLNGFKKAIYWSKEKMESHADKYSMAFNLKSYRDLEAGKIPQKDMWKYSSFWYKNFDAMAKKTMLRQLLSQWGIMSIDMQKAFESDMGVIREDGTVDYVDNDNEMEFAEEKIVEAESEVIPEVEAEVVSESEAESLIK